MRSIKVVPQQHAWVIERLGRQPLGVPQEPDQAGVEVASPGAHDQAGGWRESHRGVN